MFTNMPPPRVRLPPAPVLAEQYVAGTTLVVLAKRYRCNPQTISNRLQEWARETGREWPIIDPNRRLPRPGSVPVDLAQSELHRIAKTYRMPLIEIARQVGLSRNIIMRISSGYSKVIKRQTQGKILELGVKLDTGELKFDPPERNFNLPMAVRTTCSYGHPYTGWRNAEGHRQCKICRAQWDRDHPRKLESVS